MYNENVQIPYKASQVLPKNLASSQLQMTF